MAARVTIRDIAVEFERTMQCNCDLDNWQPEADTGHSWVCRIHKAAKDKYRELRQKGLICEPG